jgi:hypothetical protein
MLEEEGNFLSFKRVLNFNIACEQTLDIYSYYNYLITNTNGHREKIDADRSPRLVLLRGFMAHRC